MIGLSRKHAFHSMISAPQLIQLIADAKHFGYDYQLSIEDNDVYVVSFQHPDKYERPFVIAFDEFGQPYHQYGLTREDFYYCRNHFDDLYAEEERQNAEKKKKEKQKLIEQLHLTEEQIQILGVSL